MLGKKKSRILAGFLSIFMLLQVILMPISMAASSEENVTDNRNLTIRIPRQDEDNNKDSKQRELVYFKLSDKKIKKDELLEITKKYDSLSIEEITKELGEGTVVKSQETKDIDGSAYDIIKVNNLDPGTYLFKESEESTQNHQYKMSTFIKMTDDTDGNEVITKTEKKEPQTLRLHKIGYDKEDSEKKIDLAGVKFNLLDKDGKALNFTKDNEGTYNFTDDKKDSSQVLITDDNGIIEINNLESGDYTFKEIETLEGFEIRDANTDVSYNEFNGKEVEVANYRPKETKLHLHKTDGKTGDDLEGVGFRLYVKSGDRYNNLVGIDEDGNYVIDKNIDYIFKTDKEGNIILDKLPELAPADSYAFREVEPLDSYVSSSDIFYEVEKDKVLEVKNYKEKNKIKLKKVDSQTKDPLDRVGFELYRKKAIDDNDKTATIEDQRVGVTGDAGKYEFDDSAAESDQVFQLYTDGKGEIVVEGLPEGEYYFKENKPLKEYDIRDNNGKKSEILSRANPEVTMENLPKNPSVNPPDSSSKKKGSHNFVKVDDSKTPNRLEGALFAVYSVDKKGEATPYKVDGKRLTVKSGSNGEFKVKDLPYGDYYLRETAAPEGYVLNVKPIKFTISNKSDTEKAIFIVNKRNPDVMPPGSNTPTKPPKTPQTPPTTRNSVPPKSTPPSTRYYVPKNKPGIPRGPLVKTGDIRIIVFVVIGLIMIIEGSHLVRKSEKTQRRLA